MSDTNTSPIERTPSSQASPTITSTLREITENEVMGNVAADMLRQAREIEVKAEAAEAEAQVYLAKAKTIRRTVANVRSAAAKVNGLAGYADISADQVTPSTPEPIVDAAPLPAEAPASTVESATLSTSENTPTASDPAAPTVTAPAPIVPADTPFPTMAAQPVQSAPILQNPPL